MTTALEKSNISDRIKPVAYVRFETSKYTVSGVLGLA
jgi:hypothetical protein